MQLGIFETLIILMVCYLALYLPLISIVVTAIVAIEIGKKKKNSIDEPS